MRILLAIDDSPQSDAAIAAAAKYASPANQLHVLHVVDWPGALPISYGFAEGARAGQAVVEARDRMIARGEVLVARAAATLRSDGWEPTAGVAVGSITETILQSAANWPADLVVLGTHGRAGLDRMVMGSVSESVVRRAGCPVETVGPPAAA